MDMHRRPGIAFLALVLGALALPGCGERKEAAPRVDLFHPVAAPTVRIAGNVVRTTGEPVEGAVVTLAFRASDADPSVVPTTPADASRTTDATGAFVFESAPRTTLWIAVRAETEDGPLYGCEPLADARSGRGRDPQITVEPLASRRSDDSVLVQALTPEGGYVLHARVLALRVQRRRGKAEAGDYNVTRLDGYALVGNRSSSTDPEAELWLLVGRATGDDGRLPLGATFAGPFDQRLPFVQVRLDPEQVLAGRVTDERGLPVKGATIRVRPDSDLPLWNGLKPGWDGLDLLLPPVRTNAEGRFELRQLGRGAHHVGVEPPAPLLAPPPVRVEPGAPAIEFRLAAGRQMKVRVEDPHGHPVRGAHVSFGSLRRVETDAEGNAVSPGIPPETTSLPYLAVDPRVGTLLREERWNSPIADLTVTLGRARVVDLFLTDATGRPITDGYDIRCGTRTLGGANVPGQFIRLENRPLDEFELRVARRGGWPQSVTVPPGANEVHVTLDGGRLRILVAGWGDVPAHERFGVSPRLHGERQDLIRRDLDAPPSIDAGGRVAFVDLDPALTYAVHVGPLPDGRIAYAHGLRPGDGEVEVALVPGAEIELALSVPEGVTNRRARAYIPGFVIDAVPTERGTLRMRGLPAGTWQVQTFARLGDRWIERVLMAETGKTTDVDLR
jgi:hypothetical protein